MIDFLKKSRVAALLRREKKNNKKTSANKNSINLETSEIDSNTRDKKSEKQVGTSVSSETLASAKTPYAKEAPKPFRIYVFISIIFLLTLIGIADTSLLLYNHLYAGGSCESFGILGGSCDIVTQSSYGFILQIPISLFGLITYTLMAYIALLSFKNSKLFLTQLLIATSGLIFSVYLVYVQAFLLKEWCPLCLISASNFLLLSLLSFSVFLRHLKSRSDTPSKITHKLAFIIPKWHTIKKLSVFLIIFTLTVSFFFEALRGRQLLNDQEKFLLTKPVGCGLLGSGNLAASIGDEIIFMRELDAEIPFATIPACKEINTLRLNVINFSLLEKESQKKAITIEQLLITLGMQPSLARLAKSANSFFVALELSSPATIEMIDEKLAQLRNEYNVKINFGEVAPIKKNTTLQNFDPFDAPPPLLESANSVNLSLPTDSSDPNLIEKPTEPFSADLSSNSTKDIENSISKPTSPDASSLNSIKPSIQNLQQ